MNINIRAPFFVASIAAIGGILFGYTTTVISGALLFLTRDFLLTTLQQGLVVSTLLLGALVGALCGGVIADLIGRKKTLFLTLFLFAIGVFSLMQAGGVATLLVGRFISGLATGIVSTVVPLYIAEISPAEKRGSLVSLNMLGITIGILFAFLIPYYYSPHGEWGKMFGFSFWFIGVQLIGLFFIPESPVWLNGRSHHEKTEKKSRLFSKNLRRPLIIGVGIAGFQAISGINAVLYYASQIFQMAGFQEANTALFASIFVGVVFMLLTILSLWLVDRAGRRPLLVIGLLGMAISFIVLGGSFLVSGTVAGMIAVVSLLAYVGFFGMSLGPVTWLLISEIYPSDIRGQAMGVATCANWSFNYIVALTFLPMVEAVGISGSFWIYAICCLLGCYFVIKLIPETKGKTFEEIQRFWVDS